MSFCSNLMEGLRGNIRECMAAPLTRQKIMIIGGIILFIIVFVIILVYSLSSSKSTPEIFNGHDVLNQVPLVVGSNSLPMLLKTVMNNQINNGFGPNEKFFNTTLLEQSKIGIQIWTVGIPDCTAQFKDAISITMEQIDVIKRFAAMQKLTIATTSSDIQTSKPGQVVGILALGGGYALDSRPAMLRIYHDLGVRIVSFSDICPTPWSRQQDLNDYGLKLIQEANRLGMMIDLTGASYGVQQKVLTKSTSPVIFTSSDYNYDGTFNDLQTNVGNNTLAKIKETKSLIMVSMRVEQMCGSGVPVKECNMDKVITMFKQLKTQIPNECIGIGGGFGISENQNYAIEESEFGTLFDKLHTEKGIEMNKNDLTGLAFQNFFRVMQNVENKANSTALPLEVFEPMADWTDKELGCYSDFSTRYPGSPTPAPAPTKPSPSTTIATTTKPTTTATTTVKTAKPAK